MKRFRLYKVGGVIRDELLGICSKDIDYSFIFEDLNEDKSAHEYFIDMRNILTEIGVKIYQERPDCFTIRGNLNGEDVDYVMGRKETYSNPTSRIPEVKIAGLYEELQRRDFTLNAIAQDEEGNLIDPFNGQEDLKKMILRCPIDAQTSFTDDPLRMIRALRFAVTKDFTFSKDVKQALWDGNIWDKFFEVVSHERIREELFKMYKFNTHNSNIILYHSIPGWVSEKIFTEVLWLKPTNEK